MKAKLRVVWRRRGYGFERLSFHEVAGNVTQAEVAQLLWLRPAAFDDAEPSPDPPTAPGPCSALKPQLEQLRKKTSWARDDSTPLDRLDAATLTDLYGRLLWFKAERGMEEEWRRQHPQEARILRVLKRQIRKHERSVIRVSWEPQRGKLVLGRRSRTTPRSMSVTEIILLIESGWFREGMNGVVEALRVDMRPEGDHGGYCRMMDLVRATVVLCGLDATDSPSSERTESEGDRIEEWKGILRDKAVGIMDADLRQKPAEWIARDSRVRQAWIEIAADWVPHKVGLGRPEWADLTLDGIVRTVLPDADSSGTLPLHRDGINYLIRRILEWCRRKGPRWFDR
jgi:hypothetical protein